MRDVLAQFLQTTLQEELISNWSVNSFIVNVYEDFFKSLVRIFCPKALLQNVLIGNHYKTIYGAVRTKYSSRRV